jgi:hypothetical protein
MLLKVLWEHELFVAEVALEFLLLLVDVVVALE